MNTTPKEEMPDHNGALPIPSESAADAAAAELLRVWMSESGVTVTLRSSTLPAEAWGLILIDVARHASAAYARQGRVAPEEVLQRIVGMFVAELGSPTDTIRPA